MGLLEYNVFPEEEIRMAAWSIESLYLSREHELLLKLLSLICSVLLTHFF